MRFLLILLQIIFVIETSEARVPTEVSEHCKKLSKLVDGTKLEFVFDHYDGYRIDTAAFVHFIESSCSISGTSYHFEFKKEGGTPFSFHMSSDVKGVYRINSPCESKIYEGITKRFIDAGVNLTKENRDDIRNASKSYCNAFENEMIKVLNSALELKYSK